MSADIASVEEVRIESIAEVLGQQRREQQGGRSPTTSCWTARDLGIRFARLSARV